MILKAFIDKCVEQWIWAWSKGRKVLHNLTRKYEIYRLLFTLEKMRTEPNRFWINESDWNLLIYIIWFPKGGVRAERNLKSNFIIPGLDPGSVLTRSSEDKQDKLISENNIKID